MKKLFISLLTLFTLLNSNPSRAAAGIFAGPGVAVTGLYLIAGSLPAGFVVGYSAIQIHCRVLRTAPTACPAAGVYGVLLSGLMLVGGVIMLEGESDYSMVEVSAAEAREAGLTKIERTIFNEEIDQVNFALSEVKAQLNHNDATPEDAKEAWLSVKDSLSPEAFSAVSKIMMKNFPLQK